MKTKFIPAIVMLLGGAVACIVTFINHYTLQEMLAVLAVALIIFLIIGVIVRLILDSIKLPDDTLVDDEGEVVEKQGDNTEDGLDTSDEEGDNEQENAEEYDS